MYYPNDIEDICYEAEHIDKVLSEIKINFRNYFDKFIDSEAGNALWNEYALKLARHFNGDGEVIKKKKILKKYLQRLLRKVLNHLIKIEIVI